MLDLWRVVPQASGRPDRPLQPSALAAEVARYSCALTEEKVFVYSQSTRRHKQRERLFSSPTSRPPPTDARYLQIPMLAHVMMLLSGHAAALHPAATQLRHHPRQTAPLMNAVPDMPPGGADLQGGRDESRNAEVAQLKRLFYSDDESESQASASESLRQQGFLADVPIARWKSQPFLPHLQVLLNIFQPEFTHMFESLLASPQPWYYMHLHLPGGIENGQPGYALPDGVTPSESASLGARHGTLMRVAVVQAAPRCTVAHRCAGPRARSSCAAPNSCPLPVVTYSCCGDTEALLDAACTSRAWLLEEAKRRAVEATDASDDDDGTSCDEGSDVGAQCSRRRPRSWWRDYEHAAYELTDGSVPPPAFAASTQRRRAGRRRCDGRGARGAARGTCTCGGGGGAAR